MKEAPYMTPRQVVNEMFYCFGRAQTYKAIYPESLVPETILHRIYELSLSLIGECQGTRLTINMMQWWLEGPL